VLGGGVAGSAFAILMARSGARVALVEKTTFAEFRPGEHLPPTARGALRELGCTPDRFASYCVESPGILSRWIGNAMLFKPYVGHPDGFGLSLTRHRFDSALFSEAQRSGATAYPGASLVDAVRGRDGWQLSVRTGDVPISLTAQRVVDATGRAAVFARRQGARSHRFGDLIAAAARLSLAYDGFADNLCLHVEACSRGWWSVASTPNGLVATFYGSASTKRRAGGDPQQWWHWGLEAAPRVRERLRADAADLEDVRIFPAFPRLLGTMYGSDWFAIGDAAATHDPLSGHGILYAFESAFRAAEMASADVPLERIGAVYQEAIEGRFELHINKREAAYAEATPMFPSSSFWREISSVPRIRQGLKRPNGSGNTAPFPGASP
jgi:flavin-dependent dehydrogenase